MILVFYLKGKKVFTKFLNSSRRSIVFSVTNFPEKFFPVFIKHKKEIKGFLVLFGETSFSTARQVVTFLNLTSYFFKLKILGLPAFQEKNLERRIAIGLKKMKKTKAGQPTQCFYALPPNITLPKKIKSFYA